MFKVTNKTLSVRLGQRSIILLETPVMGVLNLLLTIKALRDSE